MLSAAIALVACSEDKVICPAGTHAEGIYCYPNAPAGGSGEGADAGSNTGPGADAGEPFDAIKSGDAGPTDAGPTDAEPADAGPEVTSDAGGPADTGPDLVDAGPKNPVGAACTDDLDCLSGLSCFDWPGGYCTLPSCNSSAGAVCPGSTVCWGETEQKQVCVAECEEDSDCRQPDGYACKRLTSNFGGVDARLCLPAGKATPGLKCKTPLDCAGSATCLSDMPGGYCARVRCGPADPCESGTACVLRNGKPTCLKTCVADGECSVDPKLPRKCVPRTDLGKKLVKVCLDSNKAGAIGDPCGADLDCESGKCILVAKGTCKVGGDACLTDQQCGAAGPCVADPAKEKGVCGQGCSNKEGCPAGSVCVPGEQFLVGTCQPVCKGPQDVDTCSKLPGRACIFGQPIAPPFGSQPATYACAPLVKGRAGALCTGKSDCASKDCVTNAKGTAGYCTAGCGAGAPECPFGTVCVSSGLDECEKICAVDYDCPPQMACQKGAGGKKACQIP